MDTFAICAIVALLGAVCGTSWAMRKNVCEACEGDGEFIPGYQCPRCKGKGKL